MSHRLPNWLARRSALGALALLALHAQAVDWQSAPSTLPPRANAAAAPASGAPQDHRRAPALAGAGAAGQIRSAVEQELRLDSLQTQAVYDARWAPQGRLGDAVAGSLAFPSRQVSRRAVVAGTFPSCTKQRVMNDRITVPLAATFRIKAVSIADDVQANPESAELAGSPAAFSVSGPHSFDVKPAVWSSNQECTSRYSITRISVVGPEGFDPYTGRAKPPGPR